MSIPLDRLYNYLHDIVNHDIIIYRWNPHGSKKLEDLSLLNPSDLQSLVGNPVIIFHDQEPLNYNYNTDQDLTNLLKFWYDRENTTPELLRKMPIFRVATVVENHYDKMILVHSELQSTQVDLYKKNDFIPVYYWSHGMIALDWFRYAEHDPALEQRNPRQPFLIYNRAWSGTREYRLKFAELIIKHGLDSLCKMGFNSVDNNQVYSVHKFKNPALRITSTKLENHFFNNTAPASASADYNTQDYQETNIEIVLETLFDDTRWHLTEKSLRPIACGHPFILAATPGSLEYLRSYGFETFNGLIDETYDTIKDPVQRLQAIIQEMKRLLTIDSTVWNQMQTIAARNKERFFSLEFQKQIINEFVNNAHLALESIEQHCTGKYWNLLMPLLRDYHPDIYQNYTDKLDWAKQRLNS